MKLFNSYKRELQKGKNGFYYQNPYNTIQGAANIPLTTLGGIGSGYMMGNALGYDEPSSRRLGIMSGINNLVGSTGSFIQGVRKNKEVREDREQDYLDSFYNTPYDQYRYENYSNTPYMEKGGRINGSSSHSMVGANLNMFPDRMVRHRNNPVDIWKESYPSKNIGTNNDYIDVFGSTPMKRFQKGGIPTSMNGLFEFPNQKVRVPSNNITMEGIDYDVMAYPNNDNPIVMKPGRKYKFPNSTEVIEVPLGSMQDGGGVDLPSVTIQEKSFKNYLPTLPDSLLNSKECKTGNCSEYSTTALANILGQERDKISKEVSEDAWYKRSKILNSGGENVWNLSEKNNLKYDNLQVGDYVSLARKGRASAEKSSPNKKGKIKKERYKDKHVAHSGIIVGKDSNGIPIVEHNYLGTVYKDPINNIRGVSDFSNTKYTPVSVTRSNLTKDNSFKTYKDYVVKAHNVNNKLKTPFNVNIKRDTNEELLNTYKNNRELYAKSYNENPEILDRAFTNLIGIAAQESNLDNTIDTFSSRAKQTVKKYSPEWVNKSAKWVKSLSNETTEGKVPKWKAEMLAAKNSSNEKEFEKEVAKISQLNNSYVTEKSRGVFKQKDLSNLAKNKLGLEEVGNVFLSDSERKKDPFIGYKNQIGNSLGLYLENYEKAKKVYPKKDKDFLHKVATLAHNSPGKAFNKEFSEFYIEGKANRNPEKFKSDYLDKVTNYKKELLGLEKLQDGGVFDSTFTGNPNGDNANPFDSTIDSLPFEYKEMEKDNFYNEPLIEPGNFDSADDIDLLEDWENFTGSTLTQDSQFNFKPTGDLPKLNETGIKVKRGLLARGFSNLEASAIVGNIGVESAGFQKHVYGDLDLDTPSFGLMQWRESRLDKLRKKYGSKPTLEDQLDYIQWELQGGNKYETKNFKKSITNSLSDTTYLFADNVERASKAAIKKSIQERINFAKAYENVQ